MKRNTAGLTLLGICIILAILLLTHTVKPIVTNVLFAISLVTLGGLSRGFRK